MKIVKHGGLVLGLMASVSLAALAQQPDELSDLTETHLGGLEYRNIGPWRGGRVTTVSGVPGDRMTYYMGSVGGVFKTTDGGLNWAPVGDGQFTTASVGAIDVSQSNPNIVLVGMGESPFRGVASSHGDGVYLSVDAGKTWKNIGLKDARQIASVQIHPTNPDVMMVGVQGSPWAPTETRGIYRTTDGGETWQRTLFVNESTGAIDLKYDPGNPMLVYAAMWDTDREPWKIRSGGPGSGLYKSMDGGKTWKAINKGLPELKGKMGIAPSGAQDGLVWAIVEAKEKGGLYKSTDGGDSWTFVNGQRMLHARSWYYMEVFADPKDPNRVYVLNAPFMKSVDGGKTFSRIPDPHTDHHGLWINPEDPANMINANDGGATITFDGGESWSSIYNQPTAQFYRVNADNTFGYRVYGGQQDNSTVAIRSWGPDGDIGFEDMIAVGGCESGHVAFDKDNPRYTYAGCYLGQIEEHDMQTNITRDIRAYPELLFGVDPSERKYRFNWNAPITVSQHNPTVIYHGANVLLKSTDRGTSWTEVSPDLTRDTTETQGPGGEPITNEVSENYNTLFVVTESPHTPDVIWTGSDDGLVHVTRDGGETWDNVTPRGLGEVVINSIDVSPHDPAKAYMVAMGYKNNDHEPKVFVTENYGGRWSEITDGIQDDDFIRVVREDHQREGLLFAGSETSAYVSFNGGKDWRTLQLNLPHVPVTDMLVHEKDLVLSTQGRGFWILDDITPLRGISDETLDAPAHLFAPQTAHKLQYHGRRPSGEGQNPPDGAVLYYSLAGAPDLTEAPVTIEILDSEGTLVRTLKTNADSGAEGGGRGADYALPAKEGLNRAIWDLRTDPLEKLEGIWSIGGGSDGVVSGHTVAPGTYTVRLTHGDTVSEQSLDVRWDPRLDQDPDEIAALVEMTATAQAMVDELQRSIMALRTAAKQAKADMALLEDDQQALKDAAQAVVDAVEAWESELVSDEREFFQDVLNWPDRLLSDLQGLYLGLNGLVPPVTQGYRDRFDDLREPFSAAMAGRDAVINGAIADYNAASDDARIPAIIVPSTAAGDQ